MLAAGNWYVNSLCKATGRQGGKEMIELCEMLGRERMGLNDEALPGGRWQGR